MRRLVFLALLIGTVASAQSEETGEGPQLNWDRSNFDFGDLTQGGKIEYTFKFTNAGKTPLIITNVTTQCGCTAPRGWPRDPVPPGGKGEITISFDSSGKFGRQNKVATVVSNAVGPDGNQLLISGNVIEKKPQQ